MKIMNNNRGISLITLIITIVVIMIIAGVSIVNFNGTHERASSSKILNEFTEVETAISSLGKMHSLDSSVYRYVGTPLSRSHSKNSK